MDRWRRLKKAAFIAKVVGLGLFYVALTAALLYSVIGTVEAGAP